VIGSCSLLWLVTDRDICYSVLRSWRRRSRDLFYCAETRRRYGTESPDIIIILFYWSGTRRRCGTESPKIILGFYDFMIFIIILLFGDTSPIRDGVVRDYFPLSYYGDASSPMWRVAGPNSDFIVFRDFLLPNRV